MKKTPRSTGKTPRRFIPNWRQTVYAPRPLVQVDPLEEENDDFEDYWSQVMRHDGYGGFVNANQVTPRIWVGGALTAADLPDLRAGGITHICDVTTHDDDAFLQAAQSSKPINCLWINTGDDGQPKAELFKPIASWFLGAWLNPGSKFIFHCDAGSNRGPSACYMALRLLDFTPAQATAAIKAVRPFVGIAYAKDADEALSELGYS